MTSKSEKLVYTWLNEYAARKLGIQNNRLYLNHLNEKLYCISEKDETERARILDEISLREEQLQSALIHIDVFEKAWFELSPEEQMILDTVHRKGLTKSEAFLDLSDLLFRSTSTIRRYYDRAIHHFRQLLLG